MNWRIIIYRLSLAATLAFVTAIMFLSWLMPEHLR